MDKVILQTLCEKKRLGIKCALATVVATRGSTPRKAGSEMLIFENGESFGTIGGGCGEAKVRHDALKAIYNNQSGICKVSMLNEIAEDDGMVCGGIMEVFIHVISDY